MQAMFSAEVKVKALAETFSDASNNISAKAKAKVQAGILPQASLLAMTKHWQSID